MPEKKAGYYISEHFLERKTTNKQRRNRQVVYAKQKQVQKLKSSVKLWLLLQDARGNLAANPHKSAHIVPGSL